MMNYSKEIVCLANSRKHSGRCISGKEVLQHGYGSWIRPISARPSAEISEEERRFENGQDPRVLDIINIPMLAEAPVLFQTENHVIDAGYYWSKVGELPWEELSNLVDTPPLLWSNTSSSYNGLNDRVKVELAAMLPNSLTLIVPKELTIKVHVEGADFGNPRRRVRAHFIYNNVYYTIAVTDPVAERVFLAKSDGIYPLAETYLCISLGEAHTDGYCYKLVAALISKSNL